MKKKKGTTRSVVLCGAAILCFFMVHRSLNSDSGALDKVVSCLAFPFIQAQKVVVNPLVEYCAEQKRKSIVDDAYKKVLEERDTLQAQLLALQAEKKYCEDTEEVRSFKEQYAYPAAVLVRVLVKQSGNAGNFFLVDAGAHQGIHKDTAVVYKNCLVGKVTEVYPYYSKVLLITDPNCKVAAYCDATRSQGIYQGVGLGLPGALTHVGHLSTLQEGDTVFSSGEGMIFPCGFGIGIISSFAKNEGDMQYTVVVNPFLDFSTVDYCYVLEKSPAASGAERPVVA